ncbi:MAG TPA: STAS domain-containing protein [Trebonia sp.]|jgi:anti-anti-sigma factor|nr:STAS domain-containing protein [Trebonia sp.]
MTSPRSLSSDGQHVQAELRAVLSLAGPDDATLSLSGGLDTTTTEVLQDTAARCLRDEPASLTVDLRDVAFCDSAGVRALRWVARRAILAGTRCRVVNPQPQVRRLLMLADAGELIAVMDHASPGIV